MSSLLRAFASYAACGALCGYGLAALLFFDNRLPLTSAFFLQLALWLVAVYGAIGFVGGAFADLLVRGLARWPALSGRWANGDRIRGRAGLFVVTGVFATLFFWHFDSFYPYSTFGFTLLLKRLVTESFAPTSLNGLGNIAHLGLLIAVSVACAWGLDRARVGLGEAKWRRMMLIAAGIVFVTPWVLEVQRTWAGEDDRELRARPGRKVLLIGVDALDWNYTNEYLAAGDLPNLGKLAAAGVFTPLETFTPAYSPMVWTTIATGKPVAEHNIRHFTAYSFATAAAIQPLVEPSLLLGNPYVLRLLSQAGVLRSRSVTGNTRQVPAFWDISSRAGLATAVLGWWASSPAEAVDGVMVGDYATHTDLSPAALAPHVHPPAMVEQVAKDLVAGRDWPGRWNDQLFDLTAAEREEFARGGEPAIVREAKRSLAHDYGLFTTARRLVEGEQPAVTAVFLEGIDTIGHLALHYERSTDPAALDSVALRRYGGLNLAYYRIVDEMIGELVAAVDEQTYVFVLADHGFELHEAPDYFHHKTGPPGVLSLTGPAIEAQKPGEIDAHIYDIAPTLLYALGLPVGEDMAGRVLAEAFSTAFKQRYAVVDGPSYDGLRPSRHSGARLEAVSDGASESAVQRLKALGYIE